MDKIEGFLPDDGFAVVPDFDIEDGTDLDEDFLVKPEKPHCHCPKHDDLVSPGHDGFVSDTDHHYHRPGDLIDGDDFDFEDHCHHHHHHHHEHSCCNKYTTFQTLYDFFLAGITDDMFLELNKDDTIQILEEIMMAAIPYFEFCRHDLFDMDLEAKRFNSVVTVEEMMILRQYMIAQWIGYQLATVDLIKQKYSGSDFKFTSQASHIKQLQTMKKEYETQGFHLQRLYKRREKKKDGRIGSTLAMIMETPAQ